jgi:hypothetical protein
MNFQERWEAFTPKVDNGANINNAITHARKYSCRTEAMGPKTRFTLIQPPIEHDMKVFKGEI